MSIEVQELESYLNAKSKELGFSHFGLATLSRPFSFEIYENWLAEGLHGSMNYLKTHAHIKANAREKWPLAQSALVFAVPYFPHPEPKSDFPLNALRVSLYAKGYDYHHWFKEKLKVICEDLKAKLPGEEFIPMTDSSPVLERDLAYRAGLGWVGKNTCLIQAKKGSLFFIGEIYTSFVLKTETAPLPDFCGTCTRCIDICPTKALTAPRTLDARKCISYLTIESKEVPPPELRSNIGDWFFGCDLCQTVCPWNQKIFKSKLSTLPMDLTVSEDALIQELRWILQSSGKQLEKAFAHSPLSRAGNFGLKRNALIVIANRRLKKLLPEVEAYVAHERLGELARWTQVQVLADAELSQ